MDITVLVCTHDRSKLLARTLESINQAERPSACNIELLVVANSCTDDTVDMLKAYASSAANGALLPLRWVVEEQPGKSHALNRGIGLLRSPVVAFVDDDHRLHPRYFLEICSALKSFPKASFYCGRIFPDWDGAEPKWVHDDGPYRIYPLPIPRFDYGDEPHEILPGGPVPGGGNLFLRREIFDRTGGFSGDLGPRGHNLGGGEDSEFVMRALDRQECLIYVPDVIQYHYVDPDRLRLRYLLLKSYQRSRSTTRLKARPGKQYPLYLWRKLFTYLAKALFTTGWRQTRFFLVRIAATLGEIHGMTEAYKKQRRSTPS